MDVAGSARIGSGSSGGTLFIGSTSSIDSAADMTISNLSTGSIIFKTTSSGTTRATITSAGNFGIGNTFAPAYLLDVSGTTRVNKLIIGSISSATGISNISAATDVVLYANTGTIRFRPNGESSDSNEGFYTITGQMNAVQFNATSDYRKKDNIVSLYDTSYNIDNLNPITYTLKDSGIQDMGFLAHEVQEDFPFLVTGDKDGVETQSLNYNGLIALLVKEVQELKRENKEMKARLDSIEKKM